MVPQSLMRHRGLFAIRTKKGQERQQSVDVRIDQLENASVESARLLQELAQQVQALSLAEQEHQKRVHLALIAGQIGIALESALPSLRS
jgi:electron transfer flavoprotein alpha/beta subunit